MRPPVKDWLKKADGDMEAAARLIRGKKPLYDHVCFHSEQAAEKYLKAFLENTGRPIPRTHDLIALVNAAKPDLDFLLLKRDELEMLTGCAVTFRYPGDEAAKEDALLALKAAENIAAVVRPKIK